MNLSHAQIFELIKVLETCWNSVWNPLASHWSVHNSGETGRGLMEGISMEKSSQGCYKAMQIGFCDSHCNNIMDIQSRLPYSKVVYHAITVFFSSLMEVNISGNRDFVFIIIVQFMMSANSRIRFGLLTVFLCLYSMPSHYQLCANSSEDTELIKIIFPSATCLSDIFCQVCE